MSRFAKFLIAAWAISLLAALSLAAYGFIARASAPETNRERAVGARERASDAREAALTEREQISDHTILEELHGAHVPETLASHESSLALMKTLMFAVIGLILGGHGLSWYNEKKMRRTLHTANNRIQELILAVPESCRGVCRLQSILPQVPEDARMQRRIRACLTELLGSEEGQ